MMSEFTDKINNHLNPILVKEITQGLRTKLFVAALILTQVVLFFATLMMLALSNGGKGQDESGVIFFWMGIAAPFILIMPLRGLNAINSEVQSKTLEMLFLCNLSSKDIIFGKYLSHLIQILLLAVTILPYMILRYFAGGVDLGLELALFTGLITVSLLQTSITVAVSSFANKNKLTHMIRVVAFIILSVYLYVMLIIFIGVLSFKRGGSIPFNVADFLFLVPQILIMIYLFLLMGSTHIAPKSENLLIQKRLTVLLMLLVYAVAHFFTSNSWIVGLPIAALAVTALEALFSSDNFLKSAYRPAAKFKSLDLLFTQVHLSSVIWFCFSYILIGTLICLEVASHQSSIPSWSFLVTYVLFVFALILVIRISRLSSSLGTSLSWLSIPTIALTLTILESKYRFVGSSDMRDGLAVTISILGIILIPYTGVQFICQIIKKETKILYYTISYGLFFVCAIFLIIIRESRVLFDRYLCALSPLEIGYVDGNGNSVLVWIEVMVALLLLTVISIRKRNDFSKLRQKFLDGSSKADVAVNSIEMSQEDALEVE